MDYARVPKNTGSDDVFVASHQARFVELATEHQALTVKPADAFAAKIGGPATFEAITKANDTPPQPHTDREW